MIKNQNPDAIHIATEGPLGLVARLYCRRNNIPFTTSYHTKFPEYVQARTRIPTSWTYAFMRWMHKDSNNVLVTSPSMKKELQANGFKNVEVWGRGVNTTLFHPSKRDGAIVNKYESPKMLYVGRVSIEKNLEAFFKVDTPGTKIVVGDGPLLEQYKRDYPDIIFVGAKVGEDLARYYASADVFVFPSKTDTFGIVMLEALASGTPIAAYPVTGPIDVVTNSMDGFLNDDIQKAITEALKCDRITIRQRSLKYKWSECAKVFVDNLTQIKR